MSKSYNKVLYCNFCTGSNTEYYRARNKYQRNYNRQELRKIRKINDDEIDETLEFVRLPKKDTWREPTDGGYVVTRRDIENYKCEVRDGNDSWNDYLIERANRILKPGSPINKFTKYKNKYFD